MTGRGRRAGRAAAVLAAGLALWPLHPARAQDRLVVPSPVLTIDQDELFDRSAFGARVDAELAEASAALAAENRSLEAELAEEERRLTELRPTTDPAAFQEMAAAFDARVVEVRRVQDQKARDLAQRPETARQEFFRAALPILADLVRERGAVAILDSRAVILSADLIDITDEAIRRIDSVLGDGSDVPQAPGAGGDAPPAPEEAPAEDAPSEDAPPEDAPLVPPGDATPEAPAAQGTQP